MKIIIHIGAGKTGTSSIQMTLKENQQELHKLGFHYMGLVFEHATTKKFAWQNQHAVNLFAMDNARACNEVLEVIDGTIEQLSKKGIHTIIWSNESLLKQSSKTIPILQTLKKNTTYKLSHTFVNMNHGSIQHIFSGVSNINNTKEN